MTSEMLQSALDHVNRQLKGGILDCIYSFADGSGSVGIANADSGEALAEALESPAAPFILFEAHPLTDFNKRVGNVIANLKRQGL
ncbi:MAG TPA: hypothetical protein VKB84_01505 [Candidatus Binataceae bacterium]|nr:hypothetical protein [Candidatus Binataceae bacterium]